MLITFQPPLSLCLCACVCVDVWWEVRDVIISSVGGKSVKETITCIRDRYFLSHREREWLTWWWRKQIKTAEKERWSLTQNVGQNFLVETSPDPSDPFTFNSRRWWWRLSKWISWRGNVWGKYCRYYGSCFPRTKFLRCLSIYTISYFLTQITCYSNQAAIFPLKILTNEI